MKKNSFFPVFGITLLAFTAYLDATIVNTALPFIKSSLNLNILSLQWVANIFTLLLSMTMIVFGKIGDLIGKKKTFFLGTALFFIGALGAGFCSSAVPLVIFRGIQSLGASVIFVLSAALVLAVAEESKKIKVISFYGMITGLGLMLGPLVGGALTQLLSWRWVFWINLPIIVIALICCYRGLKEHQDIKVETKIEYIGFLLLLGSIGVLMIGIIQAAEQVFPLSVSITLILIGAFLFGLLLYLDKRKKNPLLDLKIFKFPLVALSALCCCMGGIIANVFMFFDPLYLKEVKNLVAYQIGLLVGLIPLFQVVVSSIFNFLVRKIGLKNVMIVAIVSATLAAIAHINLGSQTTIYYLCFPFILLGATWGLSNTSMMAVVHEKVEKNKTAEVIGTIATLWNLAGSLILAITAGIFHLYSESKDFQAGFFHVMLFLSVFFFILTLISVNLYRKIKDKNTLG
jgi:EmrB/QacA subfamily drug resistance transporter